MKLLVLALKLAITGLFVWLLVTHVDLTPLGKFLKSVEAIEALAFCVALFLAQAVLAALRVRLIMRLMGTDLPLKLGFSTWMIGLLISQTMVTFIAGDAARVVCLTKEGYGKRLSGGAIFLERTLGFAVLMGLTLAAIPFLLAQGPSDAVQTGLATVAALCVVGIVGFIASGFFHRLMVRFAPRFGQSRIGSAVVEILSAARHLRQSWGVTAAVIGLSAIMHLVNAFGFYVFAAALHVDLSVMATIIVAMPVMLISLLPIALAGWGVREGAAVVGFGLYGVSPETAVTISIAFGLSLVIASLPGGFYLWKSQLFHRQSRNPEYAA